VKRRWGGRRTAGASTMPVLRTRAHHLPTHQLHTHTSPPPPASPHANTVAQTEESFYAAVQGVKLSSVEALFCLLSSAVLSSVCSLLSKLSSVCSLLSKLCSLLSALFCRSLFCLLSSVEALFCLLSSAVRGVPKEMELCWRGAQFTCFF
jgi:hypothetical protein